MDKSYKKMYKFYAKYPLYKPEKVCYNLTEYKTENMYMDSRVLRG